MGEDPAPNIKGNWEPAVLRNIGKGGLQIRSQILRTKQDLNLRSLAIEVKSAFRLLGDSTLWIISRSSEVTDPNAVICKIRKEADSQRIFLLFGSAVGQNGEFKFFKKQEIPTLNDFTTEALLEDYVDIKLKYVDNGDDRVMVQGAISGP